MKTKILKSKGWWRLVVQDNAINEQYDATNQDPIVLGIITNFFDSGCWSVTDYRLKKYLIPSPYLEEGPEIYKPKNVKARDIIVSELHTYEIDSDDTIYWARFDSYAFNGDNPTHTDSRGQVYNSVARFSFKEARKRLQEQKQFWESYDKMDLTLDEVRLDNPHRQPSIGDLFFKIRNI